MRSVPSSKNICLILDESYIKITSLLPWHFKNRNYNRYNPMHYNIRKKFLQYYAIKFFLFIISLENSFTINFKSFLNRIVLFTFLSVKDFWSLNWNEQKRNNMISNWKTTVVISDGLLHITKISKEPAKDSRTLSIYF